LNAKLTNPDYVVEVTVHLDKSTLLKRIYVIFPIILLSTSPNSYPMVFEFIYSKNPFLSALYSA